MCCAYGRVDMVSDPDERGEIFPANIDNTYYFDAGNL
jgi:hypothetical protein